MGATGVQFRARDLLTAAAVTLVMTAGGVFAQKRPVASRLSNFVFKDVVAQQKMDEGALAGCRKPGVPDVVVCLQPNETVAGVPGFLNGLYYTYYKGQLSGVTFDFLQGQGNYETIVTALEEKYGKPCRTAQGRWINQVAIPISYPITTWCFSTGNLTLKKFSLTRDVGLLDYVDVIAPAKQKKTAPKDF